MIGTLLAFAAGAAAAVVLQSVLQPVLQSVLQSVRSRGDARAATERGAGLAGLAGFVPTERSQASLLAAFRPDEVPDPTDALRKDQQIISDALGGIAKRHGAAAVILWVVDDVGGGVALPVASSADDARSGVSPSRLPIVSPSDRERIEWASHNKMMSLEQDTNTPQLAVVPLEASGQLGALSVHFERGTIVGAESLRTGLVDDARALETLYDLVRTRSDVARQNFRLRGLIRTAGTLQATRDPLELQQMLVDDSLFVAGAEWCVLVRWDEESRTGRAKAWTALASAIGVALDALVITAESKVGEVCVEGRSAVDADARALMRGVDLVFGGAMPLVGIGSLMAVPLRRGDQERPFGALVFGHREVGALRGTEMRNAKNLAVIAAGALETAWAVDTARRNARIDPLTGLANRRGFDERFAQVVQETDRYGGAAALILVDIDHFKLINDTFGHDGGDAVLVAVSASLADGRRTVDIAARLGGEEFAILLPQTDARGAREVAERLRKRVEALTVRTNSGEARATASFGVSEYAARAGEADRVVERADQALYAAKRNGRNRVEVATS